MSGLSMALSAWLVLAAQTPAEADTVDSGRVCEPDADGFCTAKVVRHPLSYVDSAQRLRFNASIGDVVSLEFPDGVKLKGEPALGNTALFAFKSSQEPLRLLVWPKVPPRVQGVTPHDLQGVTSNLQVFLDSGVTVILDMKITPRSRAVQRVVFDFPARERESDWVKAQLSDQARRLRAEFETERSELEATVTERMQRSMAKAMLERHHCETLRARGESGLLVVWARRICRVGPYTFVQFTLRNRYWDVFHLDRVELTEAEGEGDGPLEALIEWERTPLLPFDASVDGMAVFTVGEGAKSYVLTVYEDGGKKRVVDVDDVEF